MVVICVRPFIRSWSVLLDRAADAGNELKNEEMALAEPKANSSWLALTSYLWFFANIFAKEKDTANETKAIIRQSKTMYWNRSTLGMDGCGSLKVVGHNY